MIMTGDRDLIGRLERLPSSLRAVLERRVRGLTLRLQALVQRKLSGQVLNVVTGALRRSIQSEVTVTAEAVVGRVYSSGDVKYARIHEMGGKTRAHLIEPKKGKMLKFAMGGNTVFARSVNHPGSVMPERSFLRSSLRDMRGEITRSLTDGVLEDAMRGGA